MNAERYSIYCKALEPFRDYLERLERNEYFLQGHKVKVSFKSYHKISTSWEIAWDKIEKEYIVEIKQGSEFPRPSIMSTIESIIIQLDTWYVSDLVYA